MTSTVLEHQTIHAEAHDYAAFPSLQRHPSGDLYVVFRIAPQHAQDQHTHIDVRSTALLKTSTDGGQSWTPVGQPITGHLPQSGVQDPSLTLLADGTFLLTYFHWRYEPEHPAARRDAIFEGAWVRRSTDQGQSWSEPVHVPVNGATELAVSEPVIEQADGTLLLAGYASTDDGGQAAFFSRSTDGGRSWSPPSRIAHDPSGMIDFQEPALLDLGEGHLLCVMRAVDRHVVSDDPDAQKRQWAPVAWLYQSHSLDNGSSWEPYQRTSMYGHPPNLIALADGRVLCTYGHRRDPYGIRACLSRDRGQSWESQYEIVLRADGGGVDIGYPSSAALADGTIVTAYYFHTQENPLCRIEITRWQLPE